METLLRCVLLTTLLGSCGSSSSAPAKPISHCKVPAWPILPPIELDAPDPAHVCMAPQEATELAVWVHQVHEIEQALKGCNLVDRVPQ